MDTTSWIIIGALVLVAIVSLVFGILSFVKYGKTGKKSFLFWGILLTFIIPGILIYFALKFYVPSIMIEYMPSPDNGMVYMPAPV